MKTMMLAMGQGQNWHLPCRGTGVKPWVLFRQSSVPLKWLHPLYGQDAAFLVWHLSLDYLYFSPLVGGQKGCRHPNGSEVLELNTPPLSTSQLRGGIPTDSPRQHWGGAFPTDSVWHPMQSASGCLSCRLKCNSMQLYSEVNCILFNGLT